MPSAICRTVSLPETILRIHNGANKSFRRPGVLLGGESPWLGSVKAGSARRAQLPFFLGSTVHDLQGRLWAQPEDSE